MSGHKTKRLIHSLLAEVAGGVHLEGQRFLPRRRIESMWGVSARTVHEAILFLVSTDVLERCNRKRIVVAHGGVEHARQQLSRVRVSALPLAEVSGGKDAESGDTVPAPAAEQPVLLYEHLVKSLLEEVASGAYAGGHRFLSQRAISAMWNVSQPTVTRAREILLQHGVLHQPNSRITVVADEGATRACLLLQQMRFETLPPPENWKIRRNRLVRDVKNSDGLRLAVLYGGDSLDAVGLRRELELLPAARDGSTLVPKRHLLAFVEEAQRAGCETFLYRYQSGGDAQKKMLQQLARDRIDGVAIIDPTRRIGIDRLLGTLKSRGISVVTAFDTYRGLSDSSIVCNETAAGYAAMQELLGAGHRDILLIRGKPAKVFLQQREEGAHACLDNFQYKRDSRLRSLRCTEDEPAEIEKLSQLLGDPADRPTAVLVIDTQLLIEIDRAFRDSGVRIPQDISLISCGVREHGYQFFTPPDTLLRDHILYGQSAARQLISLILGEPVPRTLHLATPYVRRGTVARPQRSRSTLSSSPPGRESLSQTLR